MFVIYCGSFSQLLNYNICCHEIQQSLLAPWDTLGPWTHSAYIVHFSTIFVPLSLHRRPYFPLQEPFISQSWILPTIFFLPHSTFSLQISLLSPELTLIYFFSHRSPNCPTSGFPRQPTPIWSGPSFWPSLFVSPQIEIREYIDDIILCDPSLQISQTNTFALLNFLSSQGYRVLSSKVQLFTPQVICLGLNITPTHKAITFERKHLIQSLAILSTKEEILSFLEITYIPGPPLSPSLLTPYIRKPLAPHMKPFSFLSPFRSFIRISSRFQPFISQN